VPTLTETALRCPLCGGTEARELDAAPAGRDHYARAAEIPAETPITSHFCLGCGVIFTVPRVLEGLARNVYEMNLPLHPHGKMNFERLFGPYDQARVAAARAAWHELRRGRLSLAAVAREALEQSRQPLESRLDRDQAILGSLLTQAGRTNAWPRDVLVLGCPLMSFMAVALHRRHAARLTTLISFDENYWGDDCRINGRRCVRSTAVLEAVTDVERWDDLGHYDFVYIAEALDHTYDTAALLRRVAAHLTPGGLVCVQNHVFLERKRAFSRFAAQHAVVFTEASWRNLVGFTGFEQVGIEFDDDDFYALVTPAPPRPLERPGADAYEAVWALTGGPVDG
jgi:hypothetical protein